MNRILIVALLIVLVSCESESENTDTAHLQGTWRVISREDIATGIVTAFPDTIDTKVLLNITKDTLQLMCNERFLGESKFSIVGDKIFVEGLEYIELCAVNGWVEITATSVSFAQSYLLNNGKLHIYSSSQGRFHLIFNLE